MNNEITFQPSKTFRNTTDVLVSGTRIGFYEITRYGYVKGIAFVGGVQRSIGQSMDEQEIINRIFEAYTAGK